MNHPDLFTRLTTTNKDCTPASMNIPLTVYMLEEECSGSSTSNTATPLLATVRNQDAQSISREEEERSRRLTPTLFTTEDSSLPTNFMPNCSKLNDSANDAPPVNKLRSQASDKNATRRQKNRIAAQRFRDKQKRNFQEWNLKVLKLRRERNIWREILSLLSD